MIRDYFVTHRIVKIRIPDKNVTIPDIFCSVGIPLTKINIENTARCQPELAGKNTKYLQASTLKHTRLFAVCAFTLNRYPFLDPTTSLHPECVLILHSNTEIQIIWFQRL